MTAEPKIFDLSFLEEMDDTNFLKQVIKLYLEDTPQDLTEMKEALLIPEPDTIAKKAHKLKSSTGMLQANKLFDILEETEKLAKEGQVTTELNELIAHAQYEFDSLKKALETHLETL